MGGEVAAYFDLDGTLLNASSEKTLTAYLARRRPWRIPWGAVAWTSGFITNMIRGRAVYDAARNRGHLSLASWDVLERYSRLLASEKLKAFGSVLIFIFILFLTINNYIFNQSGKDWQREF